MKRAEAGEAESVSKSEAETEAETEAVTNATAAGIHPSTFAALNELATPPLPPTSPVASLKLTQASESCVAAAGSEAVTGQ